MYEILYRKYICTVFMYKIIRIWQIIITKFIVYYDELDGEG